MAYPTDTEDMNAHTISDDMAPSILDMDDAEFDAYAAMCEAAAPRIPVGRDRFGRFTRRVDVNEVEVWVNDVNGDSHAPTCGNLRGTKRKAGVAVESTGARTGWSCHACTWVDARNPWVMDRDNAPVSGTQTCATCNVELGMKKFPTIVICGFRMRAVACRGCEGTARKAGVPFDNFAMTHDRYVHDMNDFNASGVAVGDIEYVSIASMWTKEAA